MKKVIISLSIIAVVAIVSIGITTAYFSDIEKSENNTMTAGTMDLNIDGGDTAVTTMNLNEKAPGDFGTERSILKNVGSLAGKLNISIGTVNNYPCAGEDHGKHDGTEYCNDTAGALGANAEMALYIDVNKDGAWNNGDIGLRSGNEIYEKNSSTELDYDTINNYDGSLWSNVYAGLMASGDEDDFVINWRIPTEAGNEIQGDALDFDITFTLRQDSDPNQN